MRSQSPLAWLVAAAAALSCGQGSGERAGPPDAGSAPPVADAGTPRPTDTPVVRRSRALMGTVFEILVVDEPGAPVGPAIDAAFDEIARLESLMSEWRPNTQISAVNAAAGRAAVSVSPELIEVLHEANTVSVASHGAFDASWAALRGLWSFRSETPTVPTAAETSARARLVDYRRIRIDDAARTVRLERPAMAIGLGGIAKGYALDHAAAILRARHITNFVLYAGGQVFVSGTRGPRPWRVGIQHPRRADVYFAYFSPGDGSVSTSGDYEHFFMKDGVRYHHILDPKTGRPVTRTVAVTVIAPRGVQADAWSTALFVLGPEEGMAAAQRAGIEALFIDPQLRITTTPGFRRELTFTMPLGSEPPAAITPPAR